MIKFKESRFSKSIRPWISSNIFSLILVTILPLLIWTYSPMYTKEESIPVYEEIVSNELDRPYVYRQFVPLISRLVMNVFHLGADIAIFVVLIILFIGFAYSFRYLYSAFWERTIFSELILALGTIIIFIGIHRRFMKFYDVSTVFFLTLCLGLLANKQIFKYLFLFPFACLNKETCILLVFFYSIYFFKRQKSSLYFPSLIFQLGIFTAIRIILMINFRNNPGSVALFRPLKNLEMYLESPDSTAILIIGIAGLLFLIFSRWDSKPNFLRMAFLTIFPPLLILYLFMGKSFEIRVFTEIYPIGFLLAISTLKTIPQTRLSPSVHRQDRNR